MFEGKEIGLKGTTQYIRRSYAACGKFQWVRELVKNSIEANAKKILLGIEWEAAAKHNIYRRTVIDDGEGMDAEELYEYFSEVGAGKKKIDGIHDNYGIGARIATLPWNPLGVVIISRKNGKDYMIWMLYDAERDKYVLAHFDAPEGKVVVIDPARVTAEGIEWHKIMPKWVGDHGTAVILMGSTSHPDTILGNPDNTAEADLNGISIYLNTRFYQVDAEIKVIGPRYSDKAKWPRRQVGEKKLHSRIIRGALHHFTGVKWTKGKLHQGVMKLAQERVTARWFFWEGEHPEIWGQAQSYGYIAIMYKGELYDITNDKRKFRWFNVGEHKVKQNLSIILEPQYYDNGQGQWGISPEQSRNRLNFSGAQEKNVEIPLAEWGDEFGSQLPEVIKKALADARGESDPSTIDQNYVKRLMTTYKDRWKIPILVIPSDTKPGDEAAHPTGNLVAPLFITAGGDEAGIIGGPGPSKGGSRITKEVRPEAAPGGDQRGRKKIKYIGAPTFSYNNDPENYEEDCFVTWRPKDPEGPVVLLNTDADVIKNAVTFHQARYGESHAEEIANIVRQVFGEIAVTVVAHLQQRLKSRLSEEEIDDKFRNDFALTTAVMGYMNTDGHINPRLRKFGHQRTTQSAADQ